MKTKKTVTPFNMQEIARALREMISEDSPNASEALLSGTREAVFREIFIFHYPSFSLIPFGVKSIIGIKFH